MPRITTDGPFDLMDAALDEGSGSSTFDVCSGCLDDFGGAGAPWPKHKRLEPYNGECSVPGLVIADGVEHPDYEDDPYFPGETYHCEVCDVQLTNADD
jgi:hypothetical protein